jgi:hypothetical protein
MKPEGSLPFSQEHSTGLCPEPDKFNPRPHPIYLWYVLILSSNLRLGLSSGLFPSDFRNKTLYALLSHGCYISSLSYPPWPDNSNNIRIKKIKINPQNKYDVENDDHEWCVDKNYLVEDCCGYLKIHLAFIWRDRKMSKTSAKRARNLTDIRNCHLPNNNLEHYQYTILLSNAG